MKTKEELDNLKEEYSQLSKKLNELTEEELKEVSGGLYGPTGVKTRMKCENPACGSTFFKIWDGPCIYCLPYECPNCQEMTLKVVELLPY